MVAFSFDGKRVLFKRWFSGQPVPRILQDYGYDPLLVPEDEHIIVRTSIGRTIIRDGMFILRDGRFNKEDLQFASEEQFRMGFAVVDGHCVYRKR